jgi:hypothetical protein
MEIDLTVPRDDFDAEAFRRAADRLADIISDDEHVRLTVTTDFVGAVRSTVTDADYAAQYEQEREFAIALAKTITQDDGSTDLIVDARLFGMSADNGAAEHTFEHEALHIAIAQRGESLNDLRIRQGLGRDSSPGVFASMAGVSSEEYRVERALSATGGQAGPDSPLAQFGGIVCRFDDRIWEVSRQYQVDLDVAAICKVVIEVFHAVATWTAYIAAEIDASGDAMKIEVPENVEERVLGSAWRSLVETLRCLPAADVPTAREDLDRQAAVVARRLEDWLKHIGFSLSDTDGGEYHFGVLNPAEWVG